jgi:hypothetical protein
MHPSAGISVIYSRVQELFDPVKLLAIRDDVLERRWYSIDGKKEIDQIVVPRSKVKKILAEMHGDTSAVYLGTKNVIDKVRQCYYWFYLRDEGEKKC